MVMSSPLPSQIYTINCNYQYHARWQYPYGWSWSPVQGLKLRYQFRIQPCICRFTRPVPIHLISISFMDTYYLSAEEAYYEPTKRQSPPPLPNSHSVLRFVLATTFCLDVSHSHLSASGKALWNPIHTFTFNGWGSLIIMWCGRRTGRWRPGFTVVSCTATA